MPQVPQIPESESTIRVLLTTDNHIGHNETHPHLSEDTHLTFREILSIAANSNVDFILQAGDLFDISKPSKRSLWNVTKALRDYCLGDKPCELELLSDPHETIAGGAGVNYEDPNINVSIPVFAISGNHDEASGQGLLSPLDLLSASGLINRIGRVEAEDDVKVAPVLLQKGSTKLALYGLGNVRDERLKRSLEEEKVKFLRPIAREEEYFNLLAVHQNHIAHAETVAYLPEQYLPSFMDLIVWGHEHECIPEPVRNEEMGFDVLQPGSSVATSLCPAETRTKHVFILSISGTDYSLQKIRLKTVRPFAMKEVKLADVKQLSPGTSFKTEVNEYLINLVNELIAQAREEYLDANKQQLEGLTEEELESMLPLPLVRLRVDYTGGYEVENPRRFSNRFVGQVANVDNVVQFYLKKSPKTNTNKARKLTMMDDTKERGNGNDDEEEQPQSIQSYIQAYLQNYELSLLPELGLSNAVRRMVDHNEKTEIATYIDQETELQVNQFLQLLEQDKEEGAAGEGCALDEHVDFQKGFKEILKTVKDDRLHSAMKESYKNKPQQESESKSNSKSNSKSKTVAKTAAAAAKATTATTRAGRKKRTDPVEDSDEEMEEFNYEPPKPTAKRGRATTAAATTSKAQAQAKAKPVPRGRTQAAAKSTIEVIDSDEDEELPDFNDQEEDDEEYEDENLQQTYPRNRSKSNQTRISRTSRAPPPPRESYVISSDDDDDDEIVSASDIEEEESVKQPIIRRAVGTTKGKRAKAPTKASSTPSTSSQSQLPITGSIAALLSRKKKTTTNNK